MLQRESVQIQIHCNAVQWQLVKNLFGGHTQFLTKTKEMVVDFRRNKPHPQPIAIGGSTWRWPRPTGTWGYSVMIGWTDLQTWIPSAGRDRAVCTSWGSWGPSTSVESCCRCFTCSLWWPVSSFMLWCAGEEAARRGMQHDWTDWGRLALWSEQSWTLLSWWQRERP